MTFAIRAIAVLAIGATAAGCGDPVTPIFSWSAEMAASASVGTVTIVNQSSNATEAGLQTLKVVIDRQTSACARGSTKYDMRIRIDNYQLANAGMTLFLGDYHEISAEVTMVDPASNNSVADYYIQERRIGAGLIGVAILSGGAQSISSDFASSICKKIFNAR